MIEFESLESLEDEVFLRCPWCGEEISVLIDASTPTQVYIEDCEVCCRPMHISVHHSDGQRHVEARASARG